MGKMEFITEYRAYNLLGLGMILAEGSGDEGTVL